MISSLWLSRAFSYLSLLLSHKLDFWKSAVKSCCNSQDYLRSTERWIRENLSRRGINKLLSSLYSPKDADCGQALPHDTSQRPSTSAAWSAGTRFTTYSLSGQLSGWSRYPPSITNFSTCSLESPWYGCSAKLLISQRTTPNDLRKKQDSWWETFWRPTSDSLILENAYFKIILLYF